MRTHTRLALISIAVVLGPAFVVAAPTPLVTWQTDGVAFSVDDNGSFGQIRRRTHARNYLATNEPAPLLSVKVGGVLHAPDSAGWDASAKRLTLRFDKAGVTASIKAEAGPSHVALELIAIEPASRVTVVVWGPYPTTLRQTVGEFQGDAPPKVTVTFKSIGQPSRVKK